MSEIVITIEHDRDGYPTRVDFNSGCRFLDMVAVSRTSVAALQASLVVDRVNSREAIARMAAAVERLSDAVGEVEAACGISSEEAYCIADGVSTTGPIGRA